MSRRNQSGNIRELLLIMLPFFSVFPALGLIMLGLSGGTVSACIGKSADALGLLKACRNWCLLICVLALLALALTVTATVFSIKALWARQNGRNLIGHAVKLGAVILFLEAVLIGALVFRGGVLSTITDAQADIQQIERSELETSALWIYPGRTSAHLPGPFSAGHPSPLTKHYASDNSLETWDPYLFPAALEFAPEFVYKASESLEWNQEHGRPYEITSTSRLHFVVSAD